ncbi:hypothetical protein CDEST_02597 [Colletotrichum destructivum]|uniref:Uncharacterized protein n=1 Tax=Colletotrichum destructivum TaxID=34406 RepID=A0AAX4I2J2_9PEZI|nr:hypothetical protein CDEST_02597 [Colletotrichum destructivum]
MIIVPEKQTRYWRNRSPYPRTSRTPSSSPPAHEADDDWSESSENDDDRSIFHSGDEEQQLPRPIAETETDSKSVSLSATPAIMTLSSPGSFTSETELRSTRYQRTAETRASLADGWEPWPALRRSITWDLDSTPGNPCRPRATRHSTLPSDQSTYIDTHPANNLSELLELQETRSEEELGPRSQHLRPVRSNLTAVELSRSPLHNTGSLQSTGVPARTNQSRDPFVTGNLGYSLSRVVSPSLPFPRQYQPLVRWSLNVSATMASQSDSMSDLTTESEEDDDDDEDEDDDAYWANLSHRLAAAIPESELPRVGDPAPFPSRPPGEEIVVFHESMWCHCVTCCDWKRAFTSRPRGVCLNARVVSRSEAAEMRAKAMNELARWLLAGIVAVWVLMMAANLKLVALEEMR